MNIKKLLQGFLVGLAFQKASSTLPTGFSHKKTNTSSQICPRYSGGNVTNNDFYNNVMNNYEDLERKYGDAFENAEDLSDISDVVDNECGDDEFDDNDLDMFPSKERKKQEYLDDEDLDMFPNHPNKPKREYLDDEDLDMFPNHPNKPKQEYLDDDDLDMFPNHPNKPKQEYIDDDDSLSMFPRRYNLETQNQDNQN